MSEREIKLKVEITRNYGVHSITFGMDEVVTVANGHERREAYNGLVKQIQDQIAVYEAYDLPNLKLPVLQGNQPQASNRVETFKVTHLVVESKNGKRYLSAKGGKYTKYGVALYPDTCETQLPIETYDYGVHPMDSLNVTATVDVVNGKAQRVLSIK